MPPTSNPFLAKAARYCLIGFGATAVISSLVNLIAVFQLMEKSDEQSLGLTRTDIASPYIGLLLGGIALLYFGLRPRKK